LKVARYKKAIEGPDGWSEWLNPEPSGYNLACCDCGLVHTLQLQVVRIVEDLGEGERLVRNVSHSRYTVMLRAKRNNRATAQMRRTRNKIRTK
jgi:hypothetical protein